MEGGVRNDHRCLKSVGEIEDSVEGEFTVDILILVKC